MDTATGLNPFPVGLICQGDVHQTAAQGCISGAILVDALHREERRHKCKAVPFNEIFHAGHIATHAAHSGVPWPPMTLRGVSATDTISRWKKTFEGKKSSTVTGTMSRSVGRVSVLACHHASPPVNLSASIKLSLAVNVCIYMLPTLTPQASPRSMTASTLRPGCWR